MSLMTMAFALEISNNEKSRKLQNILKKKQYTSNNPWVNERNDKGFRQFFKLNEKEKDNT